MRGGTGGALSRMAKDDRNATARAKWEAREAVLRTLPLPLPLALPLTLPLARPLPLTLTRTRRARRCWRRSARPRRHCDPTTNPNPNPSPTLALP